jgi:malonyl-CoA O-methyltransferase
MKDRIAGAFDSARDYDAHAGIQKRVAERLAAIIREVPLPAHPRVLEIGCGTGFLTAALADTFPDSNWLMTDIAPAMVERSRERFGADPRYRFAVLDGEHPRLDEPPFDLVCSSLSVQWFDRLQEGLERLLGLLRPGGQLVVSTLADGSFGEWRQAHDDLGVDHGMRRYPDPGELRALRLDGRSGEWTLEWFEEHYPSGRAFLRGFREIGAGTPRPGHRPLDARAMRAVLKRFEEGGAVARYHVAFCRFTA